MTRRRTIGQLLEAARRRIDRVEPGVALAAMRDGALLVDIRSADLRRSDGVVPGSVHVPLSVPFWRLDPSSGYDDPALPT
ncbi:MAG TPA: hypothetical protein VF494_01405 [Candidatus Limnocylindrales bacterium]